MHKTKRKSENKSARQPKELFVPMLSVGKAHRVAAEGVLPERRLGGGGRVRGGGAGRLRWGGLGRLRWAVIWEGGVQGVTSERRWVREPAEKETLAASDRLSDSYCRGRKKRGGRNPNRLESK